MGKSSAFPSASRAAVTLGIVATGILSAILYLRIRGPSLSDSADRLPQADNEPQVVETNVVSELEHPVARFQSVFWEPADTDSVRQYVLEHPERMTQAEVLEIGTGTGLLSLLCLQQGAQSVVATDINAAAILNAEYNAMQHRLSGLQTRLVLPKDPSAFSVIEDDERFDLIISNPPWEDAEVEQVEAFALYDPQFRLLRSILREGRSHLKPDGQLWLIYGARTAIQIIREEAPELGWEVQIEDPRNLNDVPEVFVPGVLLVLKPTS